MRYGDVLVFSYRTLLDQKLRSVLTMFGLIIGIAAVILLTSMGHGLHRFVLTEFTQFGTHIAKITPGKKSTFGISGATISSLRPLSMADADALSQANIVSAALPVVQGNARIEAGLKQRRSTVLGVGAAVPQVWQIHVLTGRFLPADEQNYPRPFAVLGYKLAHELFAAANPLGKQIRVGSDRYRVIGVMEKKGQLLGFDMDDTLYIPAQKALELFDREGLIEIDVLYDKAVSAASVTRAIKKILLARHGREDFTVITQQQMLEKMDSILSILTLAVAALGSISLGVGAVGIATVMTIAVSERVAEIGLQRALGAEQHIIFRLFLTEALMLSVAGGALGAAIGVFVVKLLAAALPSLPVQLAWPYVIGSVFLSIAIGALSGLLPALKAARLEPLAALRTE
jgi:putative ABC transport system permease protein